VGQNCQHKLVTFSVHPILFVEVTLHYMGSKKLNVKKDKNITLPIFKLRNRAIVLCYSAFYHIIAKIVYLVTLWYGSYEHNMLITYDLKIHACK